MLGKKNRINRNRFNTVYKKGSIYNTAHLSIYFVPSESSESHCSVVVSKKISKNVFIRHKIKRRIYSLFRGNMESLLSPVDVIFFTKKDSNTLSFQDIKSEVVSFFEYIRKKSL